MPVDVQHPASKATDGRHSTDRHRTLPATGDTADRTFIFKRAETPEEFRQVHELNYRTFVEEIGEHPENREQMLVDKFHDRNIYFIAKRAGLVVGMIAVHDQPPFSTTERLSDPELLEALGGPFLEVRLFALEPTLRGRTTVVGILWPVLRYATLKGYSHLLISGVTDRVGMYRRLGFRPLGPAVPKGRAAFVPMAASVRVMSEHYKRYSELLHDRLAPGFRDLRSEIHTTIPDPPAQPVSFLPGPVQLSPEVLEAARRPPVSHRSPAFIEYYEQTRAILRGLVQPMDVALFPGSGTLANEVVAATLATDPTTRGQRGLVLINGEFGRRIAHQAERHGLSFTTLTCNWGEPWNMEDIAQTIREHRDIGWIWGVHLETSTGVENDLDGLRSVTKELDIKLCLDAVSSFGATPLKGDGLHLVSTVSGKSLGSVTGLAIVFAAPDVRQSLHNNSLPTYLDLRAALETTGPRFTCPSACLEALRTALEPISTPAGLIARLDHHRAIGRRVRSGLETLGCSLLAPESIAAPVITTILPPEHLTADAIADRCADQGYELARHSGYLKERGWLQVATMGHLTEQQVDAMLDRLGEVLRN